MGYRELLKSYIRHLELAAGDNFIDFDGNEPVLSASELSELRRLAAELERDTYRGRAVGRIRNFNGRLRVLMNRHALSPERVAKLTGSPVERVRRWRTNPSSEGYLPMRETEFARFEAALNRWLESCVSQRPERVISR